MSPSGGAMTTVDPDITWSPVKRTLRPASQKHTWFEAWPGVWTAVRVASPAPTTSPSASVRSTSKPSLATKATTSAPVRSLRAGVAGQ
jgi:hypothetical protein